MCRSICSIRWRFRWFWRSALITGFSFWSSAGVKGDLRENLANVLKPLSICGLTTFSGFAVLIPAQNPALSGLGIVCAIGVFWCLLTTFFYMVPAFAFLQRRQIPAAMGKRTTESVARGDY